jgi:hypothetical protein
MVSRSSIEAEYKAMVMLQQKLCGYKQFYESCIFHVLDKHDYDVIIWVPSTYHLIQFFMNV